MKMGVQGLDSIRIKDNISQFMGISSTKRAVNRSKLKQFVDTEFSELTPKTFTHLLEQFGKIKKDIPLYRYRTEDFFEEYNSSTVPAGYRVEKFFELFENIKNLIPAGKLDTNTTLLDVETPELIFGKNTLTYIVWQAQEIIGTNNPIYNQYDVIKFLEQIENLKVKVVGLEAENSAKTTEISQLNKALTAIGDDTTTFED